MEPNTSNEHQNGVFFTHEVPTEDGSIRIELQQHDSSEEMPSTSNGNRGSGARRNANGEETGRDQVIIGSDTISVVLGRYELGPLENGEHGLPVEFDDMDMDIEFIEVSDIGSGSEGEDEMPHWGLVRPTGGLLANQVVAFYLRRNQNATISSVANQLAISPEQQQLEHNFTGAGDFNYSHYLR